VAQEVGRLVHVLEHLRTHGVCRPTGKPRGWRHVLAEVDELERGRRQLGLCDLVAPLACLEPDKRSLRPTLGSFQEKVPLAASDVEQPLGGRSAFEQSQGKAAPVGLRRVVLGGDRVLIPVCVPVVAVRAYLLGSRHRLHLLKRWPLSEAVPAHNQDPLPAVGHH